MVSASSAPTVLLRLAEGGMAEVFVAMREDKSLVVLKRIPSARQVSPGLVECLREEARLASRLNHPNVCRLVATTEDDRGEVTLEMEYLEGVQLRRLASARSDLALVAGLLVQAAAGLDHVHDATEPDGRPAGIVHRDVNPQNLMVTVDGEVKLLDFGIAKARDTELRTRTGSVKGTPAYLSPEQVRGEQVDRRADVFALGSTAVKLLVGEAPFARDNFFATVQAITGAPLPDLRALRPDLPQPIVDVLARALERDREHRYSTAGAFARELVEALPADIRPLEPAAIAERISAQFGLEIADRRRRIEFAIDQLDTGNLSLDAVSQRTSETKAPLVGRPPTATTVLGNDGATSFDHAAPTSRDDDGPRSLDRAATTPWDDGPSSIDRAAARARDDEGPTSLAPPTGTRPRRTRTIAIAALAAAAAAAGTIGVYATRPADRPARSPAVAAAPPADAATATIATMPTDAAATQQPSTDAVRGPRPASDAAAVQRPAADAASIDPATVAAAVKRPEADAASIDPARSQRASAGAVPARRREQPPRTSRSGSARTASDGDIGAAAGSAAPSRSTNDAPGFLTVGSTPYSTIHVDGVKLGVTPLFKKPLAAGRRRLRAECSCGKSRELWVTIEPGVAAPAVKLTW